MSDQESSDRSGSASRSSENGEGSDSRSRSGSRSPRRSGSRSRSRSRRGSYRNSKYRSRSRSRSRRSYKRSSRYSRSRSRSYSRNRSHSRSPAYGRRRNIGNGDPKPNRCLGVFGLSIYTTERQIRDIFSKYGTLESVQVIFDAKTGRSRGFCFVYYEQEEDAKMAKEQCTGMEIDGRRIRVDFSITQRAHTPTPGIYMGNPTYTRDDRKWRGRRNYYDDDYSYRGGHRRSPSPYRSRYRSRYHDRSRSRSYSPRRY